MSAFAFVDGRITPADQAVVPISDRGFLFGDGVYEVVRTYARRPFLLERHLDRLRASADAIRLALADLPAIDRQIEELIARSNAGECYIRIMVTRGSSPPDINPDLAHTPRLVIIVRPLDTPRAEDYATGIHAAVVHVCRSPRASLDPAIKSGNYLNNILALMEAHDRGAREAFMLNPSGEVTEATTANIFLVKNGQAITPALESGLLAGITRGFLIETAAARRVAIAERVVMRDELFQAHELFITSTKRGVMPVTRLDGKPVGNGKPGEVTLQMAALYDQGVAEWIRRRA
ncbi:MAG: aminotransferase class IV [Planctomycetota bacterium]